MTSTETLLFRVNGMPQGKARPRFTRQGRAYTPKKTRDYEADIKAAAHKIRRKEVENTVHLLLGYTLYKAKPVEKERERGE